MMRDERFAFHDPQLVRLFASRFEVLEALADLELRIEDVDRNELGLTEAKMHAVRELLLCYAVVQQRALARIDAMLLHGNPDLAGPLLRMADDAARKVIDS